ncbi:response regulator [Terrarubrum flagellatum]|uniref:response regulator n=1 Tax=Terrirubrum flagellatum TaxID=2895980 RepID=UPI00314549E7
MRSVDRTMPILIVEDHKSMTQVIKSMLTGLEFRDVDSCANGVEALRKLATKKYGLIISDWDMPEMSGIELLRAVRGDDDLKHIPFMMISSNAQAQRVIEAKKAEIDGFAVKPFTAIQLLARIEHCLWQASQRL